MKKIVPTLIAFCLLIGVNGVLFATTFREAEHPRGQCWYWGDHCSCEEVVTEENCHLDGDCNWSICDIKVE